MTASVDVAAVGSVDGVRSKWAVVTPRGAYWCSVPHSRSNRSELVSRLGELPPRTPVVFCDRWPMSRRRCRKLASRAGVAVLREYVALPTLSAAVALVQDEWETVRYVAAHYLVAPPRATLRGRVEALLMPLARRLVAASARSVVFGGRVVLGVRT